MKPKLIYIDDEVLNLHGFKASYRRFFDIEVFSNAHEVLEYLKNHSDINIILVDQKMHDISGLELLEIIKELYPQIKRFLFSGYFLNPQIEKALNDGLMEYFFTKPLNHVKFIEVIKKYFDLSME